jgi:tRNA(Ile)-lysidine synthase
MGKTLAGDWANLDSYSEKLIEQVNGRKHNQTIKLDHTKFRSLPVAEQRLVLRKGITNLDPTIRNIGFNDYLTACRFINAPNINRQLEWCEKLSISIIADDIWIHKTEDSLIILEYPSLMDGQEISSLRDGTWEIGNGWLVSMAFREVDARGLTKIQTGDQWQAKLNLDKYPGPIEVRRSRPGEVYSPMGLDGHRKKVSDFMIDKKVPRQVRSHFPIVANKDEILWIPGFQPAEKCRIDPSTRQILQISFYHKCSTTPLV